MKNLNIFFIFIIFFLISNTHAFPVWGKTPFVFFNENSEKASFETAESLFEKHEYGRAIIQYKKYIKSFPKGYFVDDAIFRIGEIYRLKENYFMAIRHYQLLQESNDKSEWYNEAEYKIALCYLHLEYYENALHYFESSYAKPNDKKRQWEIIYFMGLSFEEMNDNLSAFKKYLQSMEVAPATELKQKSEKKIFEMIQHQMNLNDLILLSETLSVDYPDITGFILFRLSEIYEKKRSYTLYENHLNRFLNSFPNHKLYEESRKKLDIFLAKKAAIKTKIVCILPLTGNAAASGQNILQGIQIAYNLVPDNKKKEIELIIKDSKGNPEIVAAILEEVGTDSSVVAVIGPMFSKTAEKAIQKADIFQLPMISPAASAQGLPDNSQFFFRNALTQELQGKAIAEYAINKLELVRFVVLYSSDLYGTRLKDVFLDQISALGGEVLAGESYTQLQNDFKKQIVRIGGMNDRVLKKKAIETVFKGNEIFLFENEEESIEKDKDEELSTIFLETISQETEAEEPTLKFQNQSRQVKTIEEDDKDDKNSIFKNQMEDKPEQTEDEKIADNIKEEVFFKPLLKANYDAIFIPGYPEKVGLIAPQLAFYNISNVQLLGGNGWNSDEIIELGGKYVNNAIFVDGFFSGSYFPQVQKFNKIYSDFFGEDPDIFAAQAFDAAKIVFDIILKNKISREDVQKALVEVDNFKGVSGETRILPNGDSEKSLFFISIQNNKRIQIN